jgi:hypothetical protein
MSPEVKSIPDIDPFENDSKRHQFEAGSTTPALERRKYFTVVVHHNDEVDPIGAYRNGATAIEFSENNGSKSLHNWVLVIPV